MYCVRCGVRLQDGEKSCPLCNTPVLIDCADLEKIDKFPDRYPDAPSRQRVLTMLGIATTLMLIGCLASLICCLELYGHVRWSAYVMLGTALAWVIMILPFWFKRRPLMLFLGIDIAAINGLLLFVCLYNSQHWFLSFAFPVTCIIGLFLEVCIAFVLYTKKGRFFVTGALMLAFGASTMLIELFQHITFGTEMFIWSLYCVTVFTLLGLFFILAGMIPSLRVFLERKFHF